MSNLLNDDLYGISIAKSMVGNKTWIFDYERGKEVKVVSESFELKILTIEEMSRIKGAGPDPGYIGPAIEPGEQDKRRDQSFFNSLVVFFTFDLSTFFGTGD